MWESFTEWITSLLTFNNVAGISSIASFILTIFIYINVRNIKMFYITKTRIPELIQELEVYTTNIAKHMNDYEGSYRSITKEFAHIEAILKNMRKKAVGGMHHSINSAISQISTVKPNKYNHEEVFNVYITLNLVIEEARQLQADMKVEM